MSSAPVQRDESVEDADVPGTMYRLKNSATDPVELACWSCLRCSMGQVAALYGSLHP